MFSCLEKVEENITGNRVRSRQPEVSHTNPPSPQKGLILSAGLIMIQKQKEKAQLF